MRVSSDRWLLPARINFEHTAGFLLNGYANHLNVFPKALNG